MTWRELHTSQMTIDGVVHWAKYLDGLRGVSSCNGV